MTVYTQDDFLAFSMLLRNVLAVAMLNEYLRFVKPQIQGIQRTEIFLSDTLNLASKNDRELRVPSDINPCLSDQ